jgi:hypothetical protein
MGYRSIQFMTGVGFGFRSRLVCLPGSRKAKRVDKSRFFVLLNELKKSILGVWLHHFILLEQFLSYHLRKSPGKAAHNAR